MTDTATKAPDRIEGRGKRSLGSFVRAAEIDTRLLGMVVALLVIWIGFHILSGGTFLTPRNLWNLSCRLPPLRSWRPGWCWSSSRGTSICRLARCWPSSEWRWPCCKPRSFPTSWDSTTGRSGSSLWQPVWPAGGGDRRIAGLHRRLHWSAVLHRHARRAAGLARGGLGNGQRAHDRADGRDLPAPGGRFARVDRRDLAAGSSEAWRCVVIVVVLI